MGFWSSLGTGILSSLGSGLSSGLVNQLFSGDQVARQKELMNYQNDINQSNLAKQFDYTKQLMSMSQDYQDKLNRTGATTQVQALRNAGLNVNSALGGGFSSISSNGTGNGSVGLASTPSGGYQQPQLDYSSIANAMASNAQARLASEQAKNIQIQNDRMKDEDDFFQNHNETIILNPDNGQPMSKSEYEAFMSDPDNHGKIPEVVVLPKYKSKGAMQASVKMFESYAQRAHNLSDAIVSRLQQKVGTIQYHDPRVVDALSNLPIQEYKHLVEDTLRLISDKNLKVSQDGLTISQKALIDFEKEQQENTSWTGLLDTFKDPNMDIGDKIVAILGLIIGSFRGWKIG